MAVLVRVRLGGGEVTLAAESLAADPLHPRLLRLVGVVGVTLPENPRFEVEVAALPVDDVLWYVEGAMPDPAGSGRLPENPESGGDP